MKPHRLFHVAVLAALLVSMLAIPAAGSPPAAVIAVDLSKVEDLVLSELAENGQTDFFIWMAKKADLGPADALQTKLEKGRFVFDALRATAERTQAPLRAYLDGLGIEYRAFYIANKIFVMSGTEDLLVDLVARPDVAQITANHKYQLEEPIKGSGSPSPDAVEPNITFVRAPEVWALGVVGSGTVMAGNDTGLDETHPTIAPHYRGCLDPPACTQWDHNYNWWDAWGAFPDNPGDDYGHGTHITGTMVGDDGGANQIGMAPGAQTIHCKNMNYGSGDDAHFIECFEWDLAPWDLSGANPRPDMAPDAINNSWRYYGGGQPQFAEEIAALQAAGIAVEVSAGNEGPGCQTLGSPSDYSEVLTTGSVNHQAQFPGTITGFSSRGPSSLFPGDPAIPDIMAPGENVRSALPGNSYDWWSGTSMAGPHATALVGLIWSANPALRGQVELTYDIIHQTAVPLSGQNGSNCGGDYDQGPNYDWGHGTIDAYEAVVMAIGMGGAGTLQGTVTDLNTGDPIEGATIVAVHDQGYTYMAETDEFGFYQMTVAAGTFGMSACHAQYQCQIVGDVVVEEDGTTVQDFVLEPRGWLHGYVYDLDNGFGIEGALVESDAGPWTLTGPGGYYELWLDPGTYLVTASAEDYAPDTAMVEVYPGMGTEQDFYLEGAIAFIPSPIDVVLPLGGYHTEPATIYNRLPEDYNFIFREYDGGFLPLAKGDPIGIDVPGGPAQAAEGSAVAAGAYDARPAATVMIQPRYPIEDGPNVLLVEADYDTPGNSPIQTLLQGYGDLGLIDLFDAQVGTPTLEQLLAYDVVLTWSNYVYSNPAGIGNVLADYVDAGGKVINLMFSLGTHGWNMQGRFMDEGYTAMNGTNIVFSNSCLGDYDAGHPIMDGVTDVCDYYRLQSTYLTDGSYQVASWQDGELFVAAKDDQSVVSFGGYVGQAFLWTGQMGDVVHNAILWLSVPSDVLWLSEDPPEGTVPAEGNLAVGINFDASPGAGVTQPGMYFADLKVDGEDVDVNVPVTMIVEAPQDFGRLEGTVGGLGYCDGEWYPLAEAEVVITGSSGGPWTLFTDENGYYATWLDEAESPLTVEVYSPEHLPGYADNVMIYGGQTTVLDFDLRWDMPCMSADPLFLESFLGLGGTETQQVTLTNMGAGEANFQMMEVDQGYVPMRKGFLPPAERPLTPDDTPVSIGPAPDAPQGLPDGGGIMTGYPAYAVDVYPGYNLVYFESETPGSWNVEHGLPGNQYFAGDFINGDFSTLYVIDYGTNTLYSVDIATGAVTTIGPSTPYGGESWTGMTGSVDGTMYASSTNISRSTLYTVDLGTGAVTVVGQITNAPAIIDIAITPEGNMYGVDIVNDNLIEIDPATGAGTVIGYIGFNANYAQGADYEEESGTLYLAAYSTQGELRIADPATGNTVLVGAFPGGAEVDSLGWATGGGGDVPWLAEDPVEGVVPPDGGQVVVDVTFDAGMVTQPGSYFADLKVKSNDPVNGTINIDVAMHVEGGPDMGELEGTVTSLGYCDSNPAPGYGALIQIVDGPAVEADENGFYHLWLTEGTYDLIVTFDEHTTGYATVQVFGQQTTVQDFDLRWLVPCLTVDPLSLETWLGLGGTDVQQITLTNVGAGEANFSIGERDLGFVPPGYSAAPLVPAGDAFVPEGASSPDAVAQPFEDRINDLSILHIQTTDTTSSVMRALNELGYAYDLINSTDWTGIDFSPYDVVIVGMDGGLVEQASVQKIRTDVVDQGKRAIFLGGTCYQPFAIGVNDHLVLNDINNYCWTISGTPHWTLVDPGHGLADGLPDTYNFSNASAAYYQIRATDPDIEVVAVNGDGYDQFFYKGDAFPMLDGNVNQDGDFIWFIDSVYSSYWTNQADFDVLKQIIGNAIEFAGDVVWLSEDPVEGTVPADGGQVVVDVTFDAGMVFELGDYLANLKVNSNDPVNGSVLVDVTMHVVESMNTMHVQDIQGMFRDGRLLMRVQAADQDSMPLGYVLVDTVITLPNRELDRWRYTKPSGWARFWASLRFPGNYQICVEDLTLAGYTYAPGDNVYTCMDWDWTP